MAFVKSHQCILQQLNSNPPTTKQMNLLQHILSFGLLKESARLMEAMRWVFNSETLSNHQFWEGIFVEIIKNHQSLTEENLLQLVTFCKNEFDWISKV